MCVGVGKRGVLCVGVCRCGKEGVCVCVGVGKRGVLCGKDRGFVCVLVWEGEGFCMCRCGKERGFVCV